VISVPEVLGRLAESGEDVNRFSRHAESILTSKRQLRNEIFGGCRSVPVQYVPPELLRWEKILIYVGASLPQPSSSAGGKPHLVEVSIPDLPSSAAQSASPTRNYLLTPSLHP